MRYIKGHTHDPYFNLSAEEYFFGKEEEIFMLWQNAPSVIVGANQNARAEIDRDFVKNENIAVARRISGGGTVFHDLGNVNFTFLVNDKGFGDYEKYSKALVEFLCSLGCPAKLSGRNDISVQGMKVSGMAQKISGERLMHHGCILFDTDLSVLSKALIPDPLKIESKGIQSVRKRVTNISEYVKIPTEEFLEKLEAWLIEKLDLEVIPMTDEEIREILKIRERISTKEYVFGASPKYTFHNKKKFEGGIVEVYLLTSHGKIIECNIYGDFFADFDVKKLEERLKGTLHEEEELKNKLASLNVTFDRITLDEFLSVII